MRGIEHLHPIAQEYAHKLLAVCKESKLNILITDTLRTVDEQNDLYAQGRDAAGNRIGKVVTFCRGTSYESPHQWGVAFDFCRNERGREFVDDDGFFSAVGARAKRLGLFWGGDFKMGKVDKPHLELPEFLPNNSTATLKKRYISPSVFFETWAETYNDVPALVSGMMADGVIQDTNYWTRVLKGEIPPNTNYLFTLLMRYRKLVCNGVAG